MINEAWSAYWRDADVDGCTAAFPDRGAQSHREQLAPTARATQGADAARHRLRQRRGARHRSGARRGRGDRVDLAEVDAADGAVRTGIDARNLPFAAASFDVVVSQFGVEYAGLEAAGVEAARVCRARLLLLTHAARGRSWRTRGIRSHRSSGAGQDAVGRLATHFRAPTPAKAADIDRLLAACVTRAGADQNVSVLESFYRTAIALQDHADPARELEHFAHEMTEHASDCAR
jgi:hypothetical protein